MDADTIRVATVFCRLIALVLAACAAASCSNSTPTTILCVFESGSTASGRCLTECESRCALESAAGCAPTTCVSDCQSNQDRTAKACLDASYLYWRCLRLAGLPRVTCEGTTPVLSTKGALCDAQHAAKLAACPFDASATSVTDSSTD